MSEFSFWLEEGDTIAGYVRGDLHAPEIEGIMAQMRQLASHLPYALGRFAIHEMGTISAEGRRAATKIGEDVVFRGYAVVGANFQLRVVIRLLLGAIGLVHRTDSPVSFHDNDESARAWLAQRRQQLRQEQR